MPCPGSLRTSMLPPKASAWSLTASSPTPRPEMALTPPAVEKPGCVRTAVSEPVRRASASVSSEMPRPSSATVTSTMLPRCSARSSRRPRAGLPARSRSCRRLDPVADRVAEQVDERLGEAFEDRAVELGLGAHHDELDLLAGLGGEVAHRARQRRDDRGERQRAHPDRRALEVVEQALAAVELVGDDAVAAVAVRAELVLEPAAVQDGLADEIEQRVDLLGGHADRAALGRGRRRCGRRRPAGAARRPIRCRAPGGGELRDQRGVRLALARDVAAQRVGGAQQGIDVLGGQRAVLAGVGEQVLHDVREAR